MKQLRPVPAAGVTAGTVWLNEHKGSESLNYSGRCCPAEQGCDSKAGEKLNTGMSYLKWDDKLDKWAQTESSAVPVMCSASGNLDI